MKVNMVERYLES